MSKIYTKTGDDGTTALVGGFRVRKNHPRLMACGAIDELSANIGMLASYMKDGENKDLLIRIQRNLFTIGTNLATDTEQTPLASAYTLDPSETAILEEHIDYLEVCTPQQTTFILPGGCHEAAWAHICRTICRRAEREIFTLEENIEIDTTILQYINRLSDYLFMLARKLNFHEGTREEEWIAKKKQ